MRIERKSDFLYVADGRLLIWTAGSCLNNGYPNATAGIGVRFNFFHPWNVTAPVFQRASNQEAEVRAVIRALRLARELGESRIRIVTHSKYVIHSVVRDLVIWKSNGWRRTNGKPLKNEKSFRILDSVLHSLDVEWEYIPRHSGDEGNEEAHRLAQAGARRY